MTYTIKSRTDRDGNVKDTPSEWLEQEYELTRVEIGQRGFLSWVGYSHYGLDTSRVEDVQHGENGEVTVVTHNTIYNLVPVKGE